MLRWCGRVAKKQAKATRPIIISRLRPTESESRPMNGPSHIPAKLFTTAVCPRFFAICTAA